MPDREKLHIVLMKQRGTSVPLLMNIFKTENREDAIIFHVEEPLIIEIQSAALVKAVDALEKISKWLQRLEDNSNLQAKNCGFESLSEANRLDAKNYQATRKSIEPVIAELHKVLG